MDPGAIWVSEWGRLRDGCIKWGWLSSKGKGSFGLNVGHPFVTNRNGDALFQSYFGEDLFFITCQTWP